MFPHAPFWTVSKAWSKSGLPKSKSSSGEGVEGFWSKSNTIRWSITEPTSRFGIEFRSVTRLPAINKATSLSRST